MSTTSGLTIGQLAAYAGVTVRAVRHYHHRGLLPEPERDASGYRRYPPQALVDLLSIKRLAEAGVPLAWVPDLRGAGPDEFDAAVGTLDDLVAERIDGLLGMRARLRALAGAGWGGPTPESVAAHLARLASIGLDADQLAVERQAWLLVDALYPMHLPRWIERQSDLLDDPDVARLLVELHGARQWPVDSPSLAPLARRASMLAARHADAIGAAGDMAEDARALRLVEQYGAGLSPAWARLKTLV